MTIEDQARALTKRHFGKRIRLFAPLYLSNTCLSTCSYCGFSRALHFARRTLLPDEVEAEARLLASRGFRRLLLVSGEHRVEVSPGYLCECVMRLAPLASVAIETQTWSEPVYRDLAGAGLSGVVHYQETYDREVYRRVHLAGYKRDYDRRLHAMIEAGEAGISRLGLGVLIGINLNWRADLDALAGHARSLLDRFPGVEVTLALPRIRPSSAGYAPAIELTDNEYVEALAAMRLAVPTAGIVLSTREPPALRDRLLGIITEMSAESSTAPGGYSNPGGEGEQFALADLRSLAEVREAILDAGCLPRE